MSTRTSEVKCLVTVPVEFLFWRCEQEKDVRKENNGAQKSMVAVLRNLSRAIESDLWVGVTVRLVERGAVVYRLTMGTRRDMCSQAAEKLSEIMWQRKWEGIPNWTLTFVYFQTKLSYKRVLSIVIKPAGEPRTLHCDAGWRLEHVKLVSLSDVTSSARPIKVSLLLLLQPCGISRLLFDWRYIQRSRFRKMVLRFSRRSWYCVRFWVVHLEMELPVWLRCVLSAINLVEWLVVELTKSMLENLRRWPQQHVCRLCDCCQRFTYWI